MHTLWDLQDKNYITSLLLDTNKDTDDDNIIKEHPDQDPPYSREELTLKTDIRVQELVNYLLGLWSDTSPVLILENLCHRKESFLESLSFKSHVF